jgi:protein-tyrosine phosphatase
LKGLGTLLVACREGRNRSCLVAGLVARQRDLWDGQGIVERIQSRRPGALYNPFFKQILLDGHV